MTVRRKPADLAAVSPDQPYLHLGPLAVDPATYTATVDCEPIELTTREFAALYLLVHLHGRKPAEVYRAAWREHYGMPITGQSTRRHISQLRRKLGRHGELVRVRSGYGHVLKTPEGRTMDTLPTFTCINTRCGVVLDHHHSPGEYAPSPATEQTGATTVCFDCGTLIVFGRDGAPHEPTDGERAEIEQTPAYRRAVKMRNGVLARMNSRLS